MKSKRKKVSKPRPRQKWLREYRFLAVIYSLAAVAGFFEITGLDTKYEPGLAQPEWFLDPECNLSDVAAELYPDRVGTKYYRGYQAAMCYFEGPYKSPVCNQFRRGDLTEVCALMEQALATGDKSNEQLFYYYAGLLLRTDASPEKISEAIRAWRVNFPKSGLPDPRVLYQQMQESSNTTLRTPS